MLLRLIPDGESKPALQMVDALLAPTLPGGEDQITVSQGNCLLRRKTQFRGKLVTVVEPYICHQRGDVCIRERLPIKLILGEEMGEATTHRNGRARVGSLVSAIETERIEHAGHGCAGKHIVVRPQAGNRAHATTLAHRRVQWGRQVLFWLGLCSLAQLRKGSRLHCLQ